MNPTLSVRLANGLVGPVCVLASHNIFTAQYTVVMLLLAGDITPVMSQQEIYREHNSE